MAGRREAHVGAAGASDQIWSRRFAQLLPPKFPTALGVFRSVDLPPYKALVSQQMHQEVERRGAGKLQDLLHAGDLWTVHADHTVS